MAPTTPPTNPQTEGSTATRRRGNYLPALLAVCAALGVALPVSRYLTRKPAAPPPSADLETTRRFWKDRIKADISDREAYVRLGTLEERNGFFLSARRNLLTARTLGEPDATISGPLGRSLTQLARLEEGEKELTRATELAPHSLEATLNLAGHFVTAYRLAEARQTLEAFGNRERESLDTAGKMRLSLAFLEAGDLSNAKRLAVSVLQTEPDNRTAAMTAARCALNLGDLVGARSYVEKALANAEPSPEIASSHYFKGLILKKMGKPEEALREFQEANRLDPTLLDAIERIGEEYARRKDFKKAAFAMERVAMTSRAPGATFRTAEAYRKAGKADDAAYWDAVYFGLVGDFQRALGFGKKAAASADPAVRRRGLSAIAESYRGMGKKLEYLKALQEATRERSPADLQALASAYEALNKYDLYISCLRELMAKAPEQEAATRYRLAVTLSKTGQREQAEKDLEIAVKLEPKNPTYLVELAALYLKTSSIGDHLSRATELATDAVKFAPDDEASWRTLGQCYAIKNELARAAMCFEHAIDLEAGRGPTYLELGRVYARMGDQDASKEMIQLYQKYVAAEQKRSAIELRAQRKDATVADLTAYGDLQLNLGDSAEALRAFEQAYLIAPKNPALKTTLTQLYQRLNLPDRLESLRGAKQ